MADRHRPNSLNANAQAFIPSPISKSPSNRQTKNTQNVSSPSDVNYCVSVTESTVKYNKFPHPHYSTFSHFDELTKFRLDPISLQ